MLSPICWAILWGMVWPFVRLIRRYQGELKPLKSSTSNTKTEQKKKRKKGGIEMGPFGAPVGSTWDTIMRIVRALKPSRFDKKRPRAFRSDRLKVPVYDKPETVKAKAKAE